MKSSNSLNPVKSLSRHRYERGQAQSKWAKQNRAALPHRPSTRRVGWRRFIRRPA